MNGDHNGIMDFKNPDFLLTRLANSEARTYVESRGDVERVTTVVAPNTVIIEETPALQPPLSFQDAPLSYAHEACPGIFYSAELAVDSRTHFRPIKDDADIVEKVVNGDGKVAPPLPVRNHINRIPINQQESKSVEEVDGKTPSLPPKPMPRKDVKTKRKRPPPPPPPPRREPAPPVPEARNLENINKDKEKKIFIEKESENKENKTLEDTNKKIKVEIPVKNDVVLNVVENNVNECKKVVEEPKTNKVLEIVEMKKAKSITPQKDPSRTSDECEVPEVGPNVSVEKECNDKNKEADDVELKNNTNKNILIEMKNTETISIEVEDSSDEDEKFTKIDEGDNKTLDADKILNTEEDTSMADENEENTLDENNYEAEKIEKHNEDEDFSPQEEVEDDSDQNFVEIIRRETKNVMVEDDVMDESDGEEYYWQSNLATIGEEEENNSLEYDEA